MFMFRSRKNALVKRAWKARKVGLGDASGQETSQQEAAAQQLKVAALHLLRRLTEPQLELLVAALDSGGGDPGECVLVPREVGVECVGGRSLPPHLLMVWVWRWPDLLSASQYSATPLQRLPSCAARNDHVYVCANPYHWARLLQTGESGGPGCPVTRRPAAAARRDGALAPALVAARWPRVQALRAPHTAQCWAAQESLLLEGRLSLVARRRGTSG